MARKVNTGVDLYVEEGGSAGPTLLLLHGLGANGDVWKRMLPSITEGWKGRWIIPDFRGHGRSGHRGPYSVANHAADVASLLEQDEEIVVAGHSMGGLVALALATNWFGIRVQRVAAFSVKIEWTPGEIAKFHQLSEAPVRWFESEVDAVDRYLKVSGLTGLVTADGPEARWRVRTEWSPSVGGRPENVSRRRS
jgi:pimeloyl-ACP methyl ester carboxylesterase